MLQKTNNLSKISKIINPVVQNTIVAALFMLMLFAIEKIILIISLWSEFSHISARILIHAFVVGARFDLSISLYFLSLFYLVNYIFYFFKKLEKVKVFNVVYLTIISLIFSFLIAADIEFYKYFHVKLNSFFLLWDNNIWFVLKMIWQMYPVLLYFVILTVATFAFYKIHKLIQNKVYSDLDYPKLRWRLISFIPFFLIYFWGIRGTVSKKTPLVWGHAYFSKYHSANQLALNGVFSLMNDLIYSSAGFKEISEKLKVDKNQSLANTNLLIQDSSSKTIQFPLREYKFAQEANKYNVVFILIESFAKYKYDLYHNPSQTKYKKYNFFLKELENQSVSFDNIYSNGTHTYMGVFSTQFAMPNVFGKSIMQRSEAQQEFSGLINTLKNQNYSSLFACSHDAQFDNMKGFLKGNGFDYVLDEFDFPTSSKYSALGVPDHLMFEKFNEKLNQMKKPFYGLMLTTNNHGPWIVPQVTNHEFENTFTYTDWAIKHYFDLAKKSNYFDNTIFVITADHGLAEDAVYDLDLSSSMVPLIIYAPKLLKAEKRANIGSHIDIANTILSLLKISHRTTNFGRDLLSLPNENKGFAIIQEEKKLAIRYDNYYLIDRIDSDMSLYDLSKDADKSKNIAESEIELSKKLQNILRSYYFAGNYLIFNKKLSSKK